MNEKIIKNLLAKIAAAYQGFQVNQFSVSTWLEAFEGQKPELVLKALNQHIKTSRFAPTIAEILEIVKSYRLKEIRSNSSKIIMLPDLEIPENQKKKNIEILKNLASKLAKKKAL